MSSSGFSKLPSHVFQHFIALPLLLLCVFVGSPSWAQKDDNSASEVSPYGLRVDDRLLESFTLSAVSADGIALDQAEVLALLGDEPLMPSPDEVTAFAHGEDFPAAGVEVEMHRGYLIVKHLAELATDSRSPWGLRFPMEFEGAELEVKVEVQQKLDEYLVSFADDLFPGGKLSSPEALAAMAEQEAAEVGGELLEVYDQVVGGFLIRIFPQQLPLLRKSIKVKWTQPNHYVHETTLQKNISNWGLDRVDERFNPLDDKYDYGHDGSGVTIYVLDSSLQLTHDEFGNRASNGTDYVSPNSPFPGCPNNGHGTLMASLAAGEEHGVAKGADLVLMRVLGCDGNGDEGDVIAALNDIRTDKMNNPNRPMVASLSLSANNIDAMLDTAINQTTTAGIVVVTSANSLNRDACLSSPGREPSAITVGAVDDNGARWTGTPFSSDFGTCIDLWSPGVDVEGATNGDDDDTTVETGTSPAAAAVSGMAARYLSAIPTATPGQVETALVNAATQNGLSNLGAGSPDRLLFWDEEQVPGVVYRSHVRHFGWLTWVSNGAMTGSTGQNRRAEGFEIKLNGLPAGIGICYDVDSRNNGWTGTQCNGNMAGTTGQNRRAERIKIWLTGNTAPGCSVNYRVHSGGSGWQSPRTNGLTAGTDGVRIEALEVWLTSQCFLPPPPPLIPPVANCTATPAHGQGTVNSTLNGSGSYDPNGTIVSYQWNLGLGNAVTFNHSFTNGGNSPMLFPVTLTVTDNHGLTDTDFCPVLVECPVNNPLCIQ